MKINLSILDTEKVNQATIGIDTMPTLEILKCINNEDKKVPVAVEKALPKIEHLVDEANSRMLKGGRIIYIGAGTSGRLGVLDASECPPTYGVSQDLIQGIIAGGVNAIRQAQEGAEDDLDLARADLIAINLTSNDTVIGIAASGRTPYVIGGLDYANSINALTGTISCVTNSEISQHTNNAIEVITGPEAITGSTRMKAGTAQKLVLNMISTSLMVKYGKVFQNLMVDVQTTNEKLRVRATNIIVAASSCTYDEASKYLEVSKNNVKLAICIAITGSDVATCNNLLASNGGNVSKAIHNLLK